MGTTCTATYVGEHEVVLAHVGDSRCYLIRDGELTRLTRDHSLVGELMDRGKLTEEQAEVHPQRSVITRALGTDPDVDVDAFSVEARPGDVYLICSDGLSDMVDAATLEKIVRSNRRSLDTASRALVQAANRGGGEDNITAILFEVVDGDAPAEPDEETRERATVTVAVDPDEEDTLHPEDNVAPPPPAPAAVDTMIASAEDIRAAVPASQREPEAEPEPTREPAPTLEREPGKSRVPWWRFVLALLVIAVLIGLIVLLVFWGLAR